MILAPGNCSPARDRGTWWFRNTGESVSNNFPVLCWSEKARETEEKRFKEFPTTDAAPCIACPLLLEEVVCQSCCKRIMGWSSTHPKELGSFKYIAMNLWLQKSSKRKHKTTQLPDDNLTEQPCKARLVNGTHKASSEVRYDPWERNMSKCCSSLKHSHFQFTNPKELPEIKKCSAGPKASNQTLTP